MPVTIDEEIDTPYGDTVVGSYWRWVGLGIDVSTQKAHLTVYGYLDEAAFLEGKLPIGQKNVTVANEAFGTLAMAIDGPNSRPLSEVVYEYIIANEPFFKNAKLI